MSKNIEGESIELLIHNNEHIIPTDDPVKASNLFNTFFTNISSNLTNKIKTI